MSQDFGPEDMGERYGWRHDSGGVCLTDWRTGAEVFLQPGEDANTFLAEVESLRPHNGKWTEQDVIEQYFLD